MEILLAQQKAHVEQTLGSISATEVIAQTWPDTDQNGNTYVSIDFPEDSAKLIADHPTKPGQSAQLRVYLGVNYRMVYLDEEIPIDEEHAPDQGKSYDDLS